MFIRDYDSKIYYNGKSLAHYREICQSKRMAQSDESLIGRLVMRDLTIFITLFFHKIGFRNPNAITWFSIALGVMSGYFYYQTNWALGGIFYLLFVFFDGCDGEMARLTNQCSRLGVFLDGVGNLLLAPTTMFGFYFGISHITGDSVFIQLGVAGAVLKLLDYSLFYLTSHAILKSKLSKEEEQLAPRRLGVLRLIGYACNFTMLSCVTIVVGVFSTFFFNAEEVLVWYAKGLVPGFLIWLLVRNFYARNWIV